MAEYGLIGKNIEHSFSKSFFTAKFEKEKRKDTYQNFDIQNISQKNRCGKYYKNK